MMRALRTLFLLSLTAGVSLASATTLIPMTVEQLAARSTQVVRARAMQSWSEWNAQRTIIYTYTKFQVVKSFKGTPEQTVTVKQLGGRVDNTVQKVSGVRHFTGGEENFLFLQPSQDNDGTMIVTGLVQGNFRLYRTSTGQVAASNGVPEVSAVQAGTGVVSAYRGSVVTVDELETRIQKAVQQ